MHKISRLTFILSVVLVLSLFTVSAANFEVKLDAVKQNALPGGEAVFELTIINPNEAPDSYSLNFANTYKWSVETEKLAYLSGVNLPADSMLKFKVYVVPSSRANYGPHEFKVEVTSKKTQQTQIGNSILVVKDPTNTVTGYIPSINLDVDFPQEVDPREPFELKINLLNKNRLDIPDLRIYVESDLFSGEKATSLGPLERKTETFTVEYPALTVPQNDLLLVTVTANEGSFTTKKSVSVKAYSDVSRDDNVKDSFLKTVDSRTYFNDGNVIAQEEILVPTSLFNQIFTKTIPKAQVIKENGMRYYQWNLEIPSQEAQVVTVVTNFRPFFIIVILIILGIIAYYIFRSPVVITKEAMVLNKQEGGISHIKVLLHLKNRTNKPVDKVLIMDHVTHIAKIENDFGHGTLKPDKVLKHEHKGTVLKWQIDTLEAYEERILTYKIKSRLKVIGNMKLPAATVKFKNPRGKGKMVKVSSNQAVTTDN